MPAIRIEDRHRVTEFDGTLIAETVNSGRPRWLEIRLYRLDSGSGYVLHRLGQSKLYHRMGNTSCTTAGGNPSGEPVPASGLPDDPVSCDVCQPPWPEELSPDETVRWEVPRHTIDRCQTPVQVVDKLTSFTRRSRVRSSAMSEPVTDLLAQASRNDPGFADARPVERIV